MTESGRAVAIAGGVAVAIGGGVAGASVAYHLTPLG